MMDDYSAPVGGAVPGSSLALRIIWNVDAGESYDVRRNLPERGLLVAVRTLGGGGRFSFDTGVECDVGENSLLIIENRRIRRYRRLLPTWRFWWFEFTVSGTVNFPIHEVMAVQPFPSDQEVFFEMFATLRRGSAANHAQASACLSFMLHRWCASWEGSKASVPHQDAVTGVIELMHARPRGDWSIAEMAATACLSERRFRQVFEQATGIQPKRFYAGLRLERARELLRFGVLNVGEVAEQMGFSSQFHFSRAFRQRFGFPPSRLLASEREGGSL